MYGKYAQTKWILVGQIGQKMIYNNITINMYEAMVAGRV